METDLINKLKISGLTKREAHIYLALLQKKEFAASEIASIIPVGRTKIYEVIPRLVSMGFCNEIQKDGKKIFSAVEPKIALNNLLNNYQQELQEIFRKKEQMLGDKINVINELKNKLTNIYSVNVRKSEDVDYIEVIKDSAQIKKKWLALEKNAKKEILVFSKAPYVLELPENVNPEKSILKKKILIRAIYENYDITEESKNGFIKMLNTFAEMGEEIKIIHTLPMKLAIFDEKITLLALNDPISLKPTVTTMIINHPSFALAQKEVFETYWKRGVKLENLKKRWKL